MEETHIKEKSRKTIPINFECVERKSMGMPPRFI